MYLIKTFKYRLYPNKTQRDSINNQLFEACKLYNAALEERIWVYKATGNSINYNYQSAELKELRKDGICLLYNFSCCQDVLRRLDKSYKSFFNRIKRGEKAGFPRFKQSKRYHTITYPSYGDGCKLKGKKVYLQGIGDVNIRLHREVGGNIKTISVTKKNGKYYVCFSCEVEIKKLEPVGKFIAMDMGIESFAITSENEFIENPRNYKNAQKKLRVIQRSVSRKKKGSNNRKKEIVRLSKFHEKVANKRKDFCHKLSNRFIKENDIIYIEDLNIKGLSKGMLAKSVNDVSWGIFFNMLSYKAENADRKLIKVNPNGTSQRCNKCDAEVKKDLSVRWHDCVCGESVHRDYNSALNILKLGTNLCKLTRDVSPCVLQEAV